MQKLKTYFVSIILSFYPLEVFSKEIVDKKIILERIEELGKFKEPSRYPEALEKKLTLGCSAFSCAGDTATKEMSLIFGRDPDYNLRHPGNVLYGIALFEIFYQNKLKDDEKKIKQFIETFDDKKKYKDEIVALLKLNDSRKKMRATLGIDLNTEIEEVIENFWVMGDFLEAGKINEQYVDIELKKREKLLTKYQEKLNSFKNDLSKVKDEKLYKQISEKKDTPINDLLKKDLDKKYEEFNKENKKFMSKFTSLRQAKNIKAKNIDQAVKEINKVISFVEEKYNKENDETILLALNYLNKTITNIINVVPKDYTSDLSKVDISKLGKTADKVIVEVSKKAEIKKNNDLNLFIQDLANLNKNGLNVFEIDRKIKNSDVKALDFKSISETVKISEIDRIETTPSQKDLRNKKINSTKEYMSKLGFSKNEINKEIDNIQSLNLDNKDNQEILITRKMLISGAGDKEIKKEIDSWNTIKVNTLNDEAYFTALNMLARGISTPTIKEKVEKINAVETLREVDKLMAQVEDKIKSSNITETIAQKTKVDSNKEEIDDDTLIFAQAGKKDFSDSFTSKNDQLFFSQFLPEKTDQKILDIAEKTERIYRQYELPLNIISVIIAPTPYSVFKLTKNVIDVAQSKNARVLTVSTIGVDGNNLAKDDYIDPIVLARTAKVLKTIQTKNIESKSLTKQFSYSIVLIAANTEKLEPPTKDSGNQIREVCVRSDCFTRPTQIQPQEKLPSNAIMPMAGLFSKTNDAKTIEKFEQLISDKKISSTIVVEKAVEQLPKLSNLQANLQGTRNIVPEDNRPIDGTFRDLELEGTGNFTGLSAADTFGDRLSKAVAEIQASLNEGAVIRGPDGSTISVQQALSSMPAGGTINADGSLNPVAKAADPGRGPNDCSGGQC